MWSTIWILWKITYCLFVALACRKKIIFLLKIKIILRSRFLEQCNIEYTTVLDSCVVYKGEWCLTLSWYGFFRERQLCGKKDIPSWINQSSNSSSKQKSFPNIEKKCDVNHLPAVVTMLIIETTKLILRQYEEYDFFKSVCRYIAFELEKEIREEIRRPPFFEM